MVPAGKGAVFKGPTAIFKEQAKKRVNFPGGSNGKASTCNEGDLGSIPGSEDPLEKGNSNPRRYSCLDNSMNAGAW